MAFSVANIGGVGKPQDRAGSVVTLIRPISEVTIPRPMGGKEPYAVDRRWRTTLIWPGLAELWFVGRWSGLAMALALMAVVDVVLLLTFGWSELVGPTERIVLWAVVGLGWVVLVGWSVWRGKGSAGNEDGGFRLATEQYLAGDYGGAEEVLGGLLRRNGRDVDSRLMLATIFRRSGRLCEADRELDILVRTDGFEKWRWEIERERGALVASG